MERIGKIVSGMPLAEIYAFAIDREIEAQLFYKDALDVVRDPGARTMLGDLHKQEIMHEKMLRQAQSRGKVEIIGKPRGLTDLGLADLLPAVELGPKSTPQEILMAAIKKEAFAVEMYNAAVAATDDADAIELFAHLAKEETNHKVILENLYDDNILTNN